jgi:caffeoyl-CoA O-methyltransferase
MPIVDEAVEGYLKTLRPDADDVRREMEALADELDFPIIGPDVGRLLSILARAVGARQVLELGSGYGYSALWLAGAVGPDGVVHCTDGQATNRDRATAFLTRAGLADRVRFHVGDARTTAEELRGPFDLVFNDLDKEQYPAIIEPVARVLRPGGLFVTDNALWNGEVARPDRAGDDARAVIEFNRRMARHPAFDAVVVPLRDGVSIAIRK